MRYKLHEAIIGIISVLILGAMAAGIITSGIIDEAIYHKTQDAIREQKERRAIEYITTMDGIEYYAGDTGVYYVDTTQSSPQDY